jgi:hypothetical protein
LKLGVGDFHDGKYNETLLESTMADLQGFAADSNYVGFPVDHEACMYTFRVYPSEKMKEGNCTILRIILDVFSVQLKILVLTHFSNSHANKPKDYLCSFSGCFYCLSIHGIFGLRTPCVSPTEAHNVVGAAIQCYR